MHLIYGIHSVHAVLTTQPQRIKQLFVLRERDDARLQALIQLAEKAYIKIIRVQRQQLDNMLSQQQRHQGVIAECESAKIYDEKDLVPMFISPFESVMPAKARSAAGWHLFLILDGIQDPHNLGACLRTANAAGVTAVIVPKDRSVGLTPAVCKVACGATETTPLIQVTNLARTLRLLKEHNVWIYGLTGDAEQNFYTGKFTGAVALVLGGEEKGLRRLTREHCDVLFHIPMLGDVESLNVSVATGISLFEVIRQRRVSSFKNVVV